MAWLVPVVNQDRTPPSADGFDVDAGGVQNEAWHRFAGLVVVGERLGIHAGAAFSTAERGQQDGTRQPVGRSLRESAGCDVA